MGRAALLSELLSAFGSAPPGLDGPRMAAGFSLQTASPGPRPAIQALALPRSCPQGVVWLSQGPLRAPTSMPPPAPVTDDTGPNYSGRGWVAQMVVSFYSPVSPDAPPSREGHSAGGFRVPGGLPRPRRGPVTDAGRRARRRIAALVRRRWIGRPAVPERTDFGSGRGGVAPAIATQQRRGPWQRSAACRRLASKAEREALLPAVCCLGTAETAE